MSHAVKRNKDYFKITTLIKYVYLMPEGISGVLVYQTKIGKLHIPAVFS